jgi:hypothetical protein
MAANRDTFRLADLPRKTRAKIARLLRPKPAPAWRKEMKSERLGKERLTKEQKLERWAAIKEAVKTRLVDGRCEWGCGQMADDPHHLLSGNGRRTEYESPETVAGICTYCHRAYERADPEVLARALRWAIRLRFRMAEREIRHRTAKSKEAKSAQVRSER